MLDKVTGVDGIVSIVDTVCVVSLIVQPSLGSYPSFMYCHTEFMLLPEKVIVIIMAPDPIPVLALMIMVNSAVVRTVMPCSVSV